MLPNKDQLSRPSKGRFFPMTPAQLLGAIKELGFKHSEYRKRVDLVLVNPTVRREHGAPIAAFYPSDALVAYSVSDEFLPQRAQALLRMAIEEFRLVDAEVDFAWSRRETVSYRMYLVENNKLRLTRRVRLAKLAKYRGGAKFSNAFKPKGISTDEVLLREIPSPSIS
jgi:hypothetical protein